LYESISNPEIRDKLEAAVVIECKAEEVYKKYRSNCLSSKLPHEKNSIIRAEQVTKNKTSAQNPWTEIVRRKPRTLEQDQQWRGMSTNFIKTGRAEKMQVAHSAITQVTRVNSVCAVTTFSEVIRFAL
ncbi:putative eka-like protein, partial [Golovinomyces cichoracearum]